MYISQLKIQNFRSYKKANLEFDPNFTVIAGDNGMGKSSILRAIALMLSWPSKRFANAKANGSIIDKKNDITKGCSTCDIEIRIDFNNNKEAVSWNLNSAGKTDLTDINSWAKEIATELETDVNSSIPLFVQYPVNRAIIDIPLRIKTKHNFSQLSAYDGNLESQSRFRVFFEWFRNQEDLENEKRLNGDIDYKDPALEAVRNALLNFLPGYKNLVVRRNSPLRMEITKGTETLRIDWLSDGEKCLIAMIGDLARRLAIANPSMNNPLQGKGIILIDEIDLHMHPAWQRDIVRKLKTTFPSCQFIVTTHSPQVLGDVPSNQIRLIKKLNNSVKFVIPTRSIGLTTNEIIDELMTSEDYSHKLSLNINFDKELAQINDLVNAQKFEEAKNKINEMMNKYTSVPSLIEVDTYLNLVKED